MFEQTLRTTIKAGIFLVLLTPLVISENSLFPTNLGKTLYSRTVIEIMVGLWLILMWTSGRYTPPRSWIIKLLVLNIIVAVISSIYGVSLNRSLWSTYERMGGIIGLAHWAAFVLVTTSLLRTLDDWKPILKFAVIIGGIVAVFGIIEYHGGAYPSYFDTTPGIVETRISGTLGNSTYLASYLVVTFFLTLFLIGLAVNRIIHPEKPNTTTSTGGDPTLLTNSRKAMLECLIWVSIAAVSLWGLQLTGSRGGTLGLVAGILAITLLYLMWGNHAKGKQASLVFVLISLLLIAFLFSFRNTTVYENLISSNPTISRFDSSISDMAKFRIHSTEAGIKAFLDRPIFGWGPENYVVGFEAHASPTYYSESNTGLDTFDHAHNKLVEEAATKGTLGILTYLMVWISLFYVLIMIGKTSSERQLLIISLLGALTAFFVQNLFTVDSVVPLMMFMLIIGLVATLESEYGIRFSLEYLKRSNTILRFQNEYNAWRNRFSNLALIRRFTPTNQWNPSLYLSTANQILKPRQPINIALISILILFAVGILLYSANYRPYKAATMVVPVFADPSLKSLPWDERIELSQQAVSMFPPLANGIRRPLFDTIRMNWTTIDTNLQHHILALAKTEAEHALQQEPSDFRIHITFIELYHTASDIDEVYLDEAETLIIQLTQLSPNRPEIAKLIDHHYSLRSSLDQD